MADGGKEQEANRRDGQALRTASGAGICRQMQETLRRRQWSSSTVGGLLWLS